MDVALLSNPTNAGSEASMHLYRLSGSSDDDVSSIVDASRLQLDDGVAAGGGLVSSSKVWEETVSSARVPGTDGNPSSGSSNHPTSSLGHHKGKGRQRRTSHGSSAADSILKPRLPETAAWSPDGKLVAFASSSNNFCLYTVHDGKPVLQSVQLYPSQPLASSSSAQLPSSIYLLSWEECLPPRHRFKDRDTVVETLENALPALPEFRPDEDASQAPKALFTHPFMHGLNKPFVPALSFKMPPFPSLAAMTSPIPDSTPSMPDEEQPSLNLEDDQSAEFERPGEIWNPTIAFIGDDRGNLNFLLGAAVPLGALNLGKHTDIISCFVLKSKSTDTNPYRTRARHNLVLSALVSIPLNSINQNPPLPAMITDALPKNAGHRSSRTQSVLRLQIRLPSHPSYEMTLLARAASAIHDLLAALYTFLDDARKAWEESLEQAERWLGRLKDDDGENFRVDLQLLMLLLTGRPSGMNMHEYLASKNTERNLEKWETVVTKAVIKLRNIAYQTITPVCERLMLWIDQLRGWAAWPEAFGHLNLQTEQLNAIKPLLQLIMLNANKLEACALEEELGFKEFAGWLKFELERISAIEAQSDSRPVPKHDVLAVMTYIKTSLYPGNPLTNMVKVETQRDSSRYMPMLDDWLARMRTVEKGERVRSRGQNTLDALLRELDNEDKHLFSEGADFDQQHVSSDAMEHDETDGPSQSMENNDAFELETDKLFRDPPPYVPPQISTPITTRRRSSIKPAGLEEHLPRVTELPLPFYVNELTRRLKDCLDASFRLVGERAEIIAAQNIINWQPPDRQEDDSMTLLGLARDPTKISSRLVRTHVEEEEDNGNGSEATHHWIACETPPGVLQTDAESNSSAFWILRVDDDDAHHGEAFRLVIDSGEAFEILDIEFFDDVEVALLIRIPTPGSRKPRHALATVKYQELELRTISKGELVLPDPGSLTNVPFHRFHAFEADFEPLQFALNGRKGRRVGCVLGNLGRTLEVLDMEEEEGEEDGEDGEAEPAEGQEEELEQAMEREGDPMHAEVYVGGEYDHDSGFDQTAGDLDHEDDRQSHHYASADGTGNWADMEV